jgi:hypothetical protein
MHDASDLLALGAPCPVLLLSQLHEGQVVLAGTQLLRQRLELGTAVADMPAGLGTAAAAATAVTAKPAAS